MISYAAVATTKRNVEELRKYNWRMLANCYYQYRVPTGFAYALDNGAWSAHQKGEPFDERKFVQGLDLFADGADWVVLPDIVAGGKASLDLSLKWLRPVRDVCARVLIAVQDGMTVDDLRDLVSPDVGVFVGGSTEWKLATLDGWGALAKACNAWCHVGRVNTVRRIRRCIDAGATSFDGTSPTIYASTTKMLSLARDEYLTRNINQEKP